MKVLVVTNLYPPEIIGGYEIQSAQAVGELRKRGHDVVVLTSIPRRPLGEDVGYVLRLLRTPDVYSNERTELRSPFWEFEANLLNVENVYLLLQVLRDWQPDVCYLWNLVALGGVGIVGALEYLGVPWVWHLGDAVPSMLCNFHGQLPGLGQLLGRRLSGRFVACSRTVVNTVERLVPILGRTRIVPNWITGTLPAIERQYFDGTCLKLVYAGRLTEEKGILVLLEMLATLRSWGYGSVTLDIIGAGMADSIRARIVDLGLEDCTSLVDWRPQEEVRRRLKGSDVFVFPTQESDPMPLAPLEAASVGCVPLISRVSGVSEWLVDGVHCLKADRSAEGFALALRPVIDGDIVLSQLSRRAVRCVHENFAIEAVIPVVEKELMIAASRPQFDVVKAREFYQMSLIGDALLRQLVLGQSDRTNN